MIRKPVEEMAKLTPHQWGKCWHLAVRPRWWQWWRQRWWWRLVFILGCLWAGWWTCDWWLGKTML